MTAVGFLVVIGAVGLLRASWLRPVRSIALNAAAWGLLIVALTLGAIDAGAWGMATVSIGAMVAALALLGWAALRSPAGRAQPSNRRVNMLAEPGEPRWIGRRVVTFLLTVPLTFAVVVLAGVAARGLAVFAGWNEADGNALMLFLLPFVWAILMSVLLLETRRSRQCAMLAVPALISTGLLLAGVGA